MVYNGSTLHAFIFYPPRIKKMWVRFKSWWESISHIVASDMRNLIKNALGLPSYNKKMWAKLIGQLKVNDCMKIW